jgi:Dolichyl-phosphate-mannose-protein mannosyltransferase
MPSATLSKPRQDSTPLQRLRAVDDSTWAKLAFTVLCAVALFGYFAFPTYPTYDSFYALLWGRDLLHLHLPDFRVYRGPTEHPLAIAFGMFCSIFGQGGARLMVFGSIVSFVALVAGVYRLARLCFGPVVGMFAALLMLSRFYDENLAAQGYLDLSYVALIVWAVALEVERPRRGTVVFVLLAAAGLLRPDAWVLSGVYWLWCAWIPIGDRRNLRSASGRGLPPAPVEGSTPAGVSLQEQPPRATPAIANRRRLLYLGLALIAPVVWVCVDTVVTGNPLYSLQSTSGLAEELGRSQGLSGVVASVWTFGVRIDKLPVMLGIILGVPLAVWLAPRRILTPLVALIVLMGVFVAEGAVGASVIDRYLMGAASVGLIFCAVAIGGWSMLERGSKLRRAWMVAAAALVLYGAYAAATTLSLSSLRTTLAYHEDFHEGLAHALSDPVVKAELKRCPLLSLPDNKLIPDARWILDSTGQHDIVARSEARADAKKGSPTLENRIRAGSVAVYPLGSAVFFEAIVDVGDDPRDQVPLPGFKRIYTSRYYAVYGNC